MKEKHFTITGQEKEDIYCRIEHFLGKYSNFKFAYVHGSLKIKGTVLF